MYSKVLKVRTTPLQQANWFLLVALLIAALGNSTARADSTAMQGDTTKPVLVAALYAEAQKGGSFINAENGSLLNDMGNRAIGALSSGSMTVIGGLPHIMAFAQERNPLGFAASTDADSAKTTFSQAIRNMVTSAFTPSGALLLLALMVLCMACYEGIRLDWMQEGANDHQSARRQHASS